MSDFWGKLRTIGLIVMIVFATICEGLLIWGAIAQGLHWFWPLFWGICVLLGVIVTEIWSYIKTGKTISTQWKEWAQSKPLVAYGALGSMAIAFLGLIIHLAFWGGMFGKKKE